MYQHAYVEFDVIVFVVAFVAGVEAGGVHTLVLTTPPFGVVGAVHRLAKVRLVPLGTT